MTEPDTKRLRLESDNSSTTVAVDKIIAIIASTKPVWDKAAHLHPLLRSVDAKQATQALLGNGFSTVVTEIIGRDDLEGYRILEQRFFPILGTSWNRTRDHLRIAKDKYATKIARHILSKPLMGYACAWLSEVCIAIITDDVDALRKYLAQTGQTMKQCNLCGPYAIQEEAVRHGAMKIVQYCIEEVGIHPDNCDTGHPPLFYLAVKHDRLLLAQWLYYETQCDITLGPWETDEPPILVASPRCKRWILSLPRCHKHYDYRVIESNMFTTLGKLVFNDRETFPDPSHLDLSGLNLGNSAIKLLSQALPLLNLYSPVIIDISNNPRIGHAGIKKLVRALGECSVDMEIKLVVGNQLPPNILNLLIAEAIESEHDRIEYDEEDARFKLVWQVPTLYTIALHSVRDIFKRNRSHKKRYKAYVPQEVWERLQELAKPS